MRVPTWLTRFDKACGRLWGIIWRVFLTSLLTVVAWTALVYVVGFGKVLVPALVFSLCAYGFVGMWQKQIRALVNAWPTVPLEPPTSSC